MSVFSLQALNNVYIVLLNFWRITPNCIPISIHECNWSKWVLSRCKSSHLQTYKGAQNKLVSNQCENMVLQFLFNYCYIGHGKQMICMR